MEPQLLPVDQRVLNATSTFRSWRLHSAGLGERLREASNWDMFDQTEYRGFGLDQSTVRRAIESGRRLDAINIIDRQVQTLAGAIISDVHRPRFSSKSNEPIVFSETYKRLYERDEADGQWEGFEPQWMRAGFVYRGWIEYFKDYSIDPRGTINKRYLEPDFITTDPDWRTADLDDSRGVFTASFKSIQFIAENPKWMKKPSIAQRVKQLREMYAPGSPSTVDWPFKVLWDNFSEFVDQGNGEFLVINYYWKEEVKDTGLFDADRKQYLDHIPKEMHEEYAENARLLGQKISIVPRTRKVEKMLTFVPAISLNDALEEGDYPLQGNGFHLIPVFMDHRNGHVHTIVDILSPMNKLINSRESATTAILETSSAQPKFIEKDVAMPDEIDALRANLNKPGGTYIVNSGTGKGGKIWTMSKDAPPTDFQNASKMMMDYAQTKVTPIVPAVLGQGGSDESGVLHQQRVQQAVLGTVMARGFIKKALMKSYTYYTSAAPKVYTYPIKLESIDGIGETIELNSPGGVLMEAIPPRSVVVEESPTSASKRDAMVQESTALLQLAGPATKMALVEVIITNDTRIPEDQKIGVLRTARMEREAVETTLELNTKSQRAQIAQMNSAPPQAPAPGGGAPGAEGALPVKPEVGQLAPVGV